MATQHQIIAEGGNGSWSVGYTYDDVTKAVASVDWVCLPPWTLTAVVHQSGKADRTVGPVTVSGSQVLPGGYTLDSKPVRGMTIEVLAARG